MFLSAGEPGNIKKIQASVTAARKVFRVMRPLESLVPVLSTPGFTGKQPLFLEAVNKLKSILMSLYFGADHVVWVSVNHLSFLVFRVPASSDQILTIKSSGPSDWYPYRHLKRQEGDRKVAEAIPLVVGPRLYLHCRNR